MTTSTVDHLFPADCRSTPSVRATRQGASWRFDLQPGATDNTALAPMPGLSVKGNGTAGSAAPQDVPLATIAAPGNPIGDGIASAATTATVDGLTGAGAVGKQVAKAPDGQTARDAMGVTSKLAVRGQPVEEFALATEDVTADAAASVARAAGVQAVEMGGAYRASNTTLGPGQAMRGRAGNGLIRYDQDVYAKKSLIRLKAGQAIRMKASSSIKDVTILPDTGFISPVATTANARTNIAQFANTGTAIIAGEGSNGFDATDAVIENVSIFGFTLAASIDGTDTALYAGRFDMRNVKIDCANGIYINNVADVPRFENVHIWPFTSFIPGTGSGSTVDLIQRNGYGFYIKGACDWMQLDKCFVYGHTYGFILDSVSNVQLIGCQADNAGNPDLSTREIGFRVVNATESARLVECFTVNHRVGVSLEIANYAYVNRPNLIVTGGQFVSAERCFNIVRGNAILDGIVCQAATYGVYISASAGNVTIRFRSFGAAANDGARVGTLVFVEPGYAGVLDITIPDGISDNCNTLLSIPDSVLRNGRVSIRGALSWQSFSPPVTIGGTTQSSGVVSSCRYRVEGKTCYFTTTLTFNGTTPPTGVLQFVAPLGAKANTAFAGRRDGTGGQMVQGLITAGTNLITATLYDNSQPQAANAIITISGSYETA